MVEDSRAAERDPYSAPSLSNAAEGQGQKQGQAKGRHVRQESVGGQGSCRTAPKSFGGGKSERVKSKMWQEFLVGRVFYGQKRGGGGGVRPTAGVPIPEGNWYPVVVEVVYSVPGSIPERVQYANMDDWRMDFPWWLGLTVIPVKRSASLLSMYHASNDCTIEIEGP